MSLATPKELLRWAEECQVAVGAFNIHAADIALAVVDAAESCGTPVIIQVNEASFRYAPIEFWADMLKVLAKASHIPIAVQLDHARAVDSIKAAIAAGFTGVMFDGSHAPFVENIRQTAEVVKIAHGQGVSVEAELGRVAGTEDGAKVSAREESFTDPDEAKTFVDETGVDALAVSVGTVHGFYKGDPCIDFTRLERIRLKLGVPLVLHGASGVPDRDLVRAIECGVRKINFATELKQVFAQGIRSFTAENPSCIEPFEILGAGRERVRELVRGKVHLISRLSCG